MAAFRNKDNGSWYVQFRYTDWRGERKQKLKRGFATKKEALAWEREFLMQKQADVGMTFESFVKLYERDMKPKLKLNTWLSKEHIIRTKILPYFKNRILSEITALDVMEWQNEMRTLTTSAGKPYSQDYLENMNCFNVGLFACDQTNCSVNPYALREGAKRPLKVNGDGRVVAIVGAGPAGMEAAVTLKQRGFEPVVFDKGGEIGGNLHIAKLPPFKGKFDWAVGYYKSMAEKLGIDVRLNTEATADMIIALKPYAVFIASGSNAVSIPLPGLENVPVYQSHDVLVQDMHFDGKKIVVLGGGITGLEVALFLRRQGNTVDVVDMLPAWPEAMTDLRFQQEACLETRHCNDQGVGLHYEHKAERFEDGKLVSVSTTDGSELALDADIVVMSVGVKPNDALYNELLAAGANVYKGGDALVTGKINKAVLHGSKFGVTLDA